jgi:hypothetical protein
VNGETTDVLEELREALRGAGYGELVEEEAAEASRDDLSAQASLVRLLGTLEYVVLTAIRARGRATRLLTEQDWREDPDSTGVDEGSLDEQSGYALALDAEEADRLDALADDLSGALTGLRRRIDAEHT